VNQAQVKPFVFRNYELPCGVPALYNGTSKAELWQAVRASAAAPSYFEEFRLGEYLHQVSQQYKLYIIRCKIIQNLWKVPK
jgi:calcium-independent phospholipase A2-gamma